jgi:hypothetical protein
MVLIYPILIVVGVEIVGVGLTRGLLLGSSGLREEIVTTAEWNLRVGL